MPEKPLPASVRYWLFTCCGMVVVMALLGAVTRLTESGLSMTSWDPVTGVVPPLGDEDWRRAFAAYRATPQYRQLYPDMTLEAFKDIFFWEWLHRLWGRLIGVVFAVPLLFFWIGGKIERDTGLKFAAIFALGGLQGFIGWFMVQSGLETRTSVSPYRLAIHLGLALVLYSILLWTALGAAPAVERRMSPSLRRHGWVGLICLALAMTWGALVAGLHAGLIANTWPLMDEALLPATATTLQPIWLNFFENPVMAQFVHRWLGPIVLVVLLAWIRRCWPVAADGAKTALAALGVMALVQVGLGLATLLSGVATVIAVAHQAGAISLLTLLLYNLRRFSEKPRGHR